MKQTAADDIEIIDKRVFLHVNEVIKIEAEIKEVFNNGCIVENTGNMSGKV